jgi:hypothetical protein
VALTLTSLPIFVLIARVKTKARLRKRSALSTARWTSYAIAAGATAVAGTPTAEAEIHLSGNVAIKLTGNAQATLPLSNGASLIFENVDGGGRSTFWQSFFFSIKGAISGSARESYHHWLSNLPEGDNVAVGQFYSVAGNPDRGIIFTHFSDGQFEPYYGTRGFIGFRFNTGKGTQYGWAKIQTATPSADPNNFRAHEFIKEYAWGDPGEKVHTGQRQLDEDETQVAPQAAKRPDAAPLADSRGSLGLLALGAVGLQAWRKSRRSVSSAAP